MTREWSMEFSVEILGLVTSVKCLMASLKFLASKSAADGLHQLSSHGAESFMELWKIDVFSWKHGDARFQHVDVQMSIANGSGRRSDEFVYLDTGMFHKKQMTNRDYKSMCSSHLSRNLHLTAKSTFKSSHISKNTNK